MFLTASHILSPEIFDAVGVLWGMIAVGIVRLTALLLCFALQVSKKFVIVQGFGQMVDCIGYE